MRGENCAFCAATAGFVPLIQAGLDYGDTYWSGGSWRGPGIAGI